MNKNTQYVKISGRVEVSEDYKLGDDVNITVHGCITKQEQLDNQDGTFDLVSIVKPLING